MKTTLAALAAALPLAVMGGAEAAGGKIKELKEPAWSWEGVFGRYDQQQLQRGYQVYRQVCASCHSMKLIAFRHLGEEGGPYHLEECPEELNLPSSVDCSDPAQNPFVKAIAADFQITAGVDDQGDPLTRPGLPADYFPSPYANKQQAIVANGGAYPPDQSLIVKSRVKGRNYIYSLLTGYPGGPSYPGGGNDVPEVLNVPGGQYYNPFYPGDTLSLMDEAYLDEEGHPIKAAVEAVTYEGLVTDEGTLYGGAFKMAAPLQDGIVTYEDGSPETIDQYARDVVAYLQWSSEPKLEQRKVMGQFVMLYLFAFAGIVYASYRQIWRNVEH
jgi:ubiquinol-cytochrome c reductase cytochrome c1 subunit